MWNIRYFYNTWYYSTALLNPDPQLPTTSLGHAAEIEVPKELASCQNGGGHNIGDLRPPELKVAEITFSDNIEITDDTSFPFQVLKDPDWRDIDIDGTPDRNIPVAYIRRNHVLVDVTFKLDPPLKAPLEHAVMILGGSPVANFSTGFRRLNLAASPRTAPFDQAVNVDQIKVSLKSDRPLSARVDGYSLPGSPATIDWKACYQPCSLTRNSTDAGKSQHSFYTTLKRPSGPVSFYLSLLDLSSTSAKGATAADAVITGVWKPFAARDVRKRKLDQTTGNITMGNQLRYWTPWDLGQVLGQLFSCPRVFSTAALLQHGVGRCGAWAPFSRIPCNSTESNLLRWAWAREPSIGASIPRHGPGR
jgi:hypothetical protein